MARQYEGEPRREGGCSGSCHCCPVLPSAWPPGQDCGDTLGLMVRMGARCWGLKKRPKRSAGRK